MARPAAQTPAFTMTLKDVMDTQPRYPMELYNGPHYRVVHGPEEHHRALKKSWTDEAEEGVIYKPESASDEAIATARKQAQSLAAAKTKKIETQATVSMDTVRQMIADAVAEARA